jgi:hypothetical protein
MDNLPSSVGRQTRCKGRETEKYGHESLGTPESDMTLLTKAGSYYNET